VDRMSRLHNVPKHVLGRNTYYILTWSTWKLFRYWWWYKLYSSSWQCSFNKCKMEQQLPLNGPWKEKKSMIY